MIATDTLYDAAAELGNIAELSPRNILHAFARRAADWYAGSVK